VAAASALHDRRVAHADTSVSCLPLTGEVPFETDRPVALAEYATHYHTMDPNRDYRAIGTEAFIWATMRPRCEQPSREAWLRSEFYNDWVLRQRLCQPCGLTVVRAAAELPAPVEMWSGIVGLWFYWDRDEPVVTGPRERTILHVLLPAFEAGLHLVVRCARERQRLVHFLGVLGEGAVLIDASGRVVYQNPALVRLLAQDPAAPQLQMECTRLGRLVLMLAARRSVKSQAQEIVPPGEQHLRTAVGSYRVHGTLVGPGILGPDPMALVLVERVAPEPLSFPELRDRYHLTQREAGVAELLAQGHTNAQVAQVLGISIHTARRHGERVLMKLGVHSRAAVAGKLVTD
jgi:DNA-binding CsgD family transcriptional regulator